MDHNITDDSSPTFFPSEKISMSQQNSSALSQPNSTIHIHSASSPTPKDGISSVIPTSGENNNNSNKISGGQSITNTTVCTILPGPQSPQQHISIFGGPNPQELTTTTNANNPHRFSSTPSPSSNSNNNYAMIVGSHNMSNNNNITTATSANIDLIATTIPSALFPNNDTTPNNSLVGAMLGTPQQQPQQQQIQQQTQLPSSLQPVQQTGSSNTTNAHPQMYNLSQTFEPLANSGSGGPLMGAAASATSLPASSITHAGTETTPITASSVLTTREKKQGKIPSSDGALDGLTNTTATTSSPPMPLTYKTTYCRSYLKGKVCSFGFGCMFAHNESELRTMAMNIADGLHTFEAMNAFRNGEAVARNNTGILPSVPGVTTVPQLAAALSRRAAAAARNGGAPPLVSGEAGNINNLNTNLSNVSRVVMPTAAETAFYPYGTASYVDSYGQPFIMQIPTTTTAGPTASSNVSLSYYTPTIDAVAQQQQQQMLHAGNYLQAATYLPVATSESLYLRNDGGTASQIRILPNYSLPTYSLNNNTSPTPSPQLVAAANQSSTSTITSSQQQALAQYYQGISSLVGDAFGNGSAAGGNQAVGGGANRLVQSPTPSPFVVSAHPPLGVGSAVLSNSTGLSTEGAVHARLTNHASTGSQPLLGTPLATTANFAPAVMSPSNSLAPAEYAEHSTIGSQTAGQRQHSSLDGSMVSGAYSHSVDTSSSAVHRHTTQSAPSSSGPIVRISAASTGGGVTSPFRGAPPGYTSPIVQQTSSQPTSAPSQFYAHQQQQQPSQQPFLYYYPAASAGNRPSQGVVSPHNSQHAFTDPSSVFAISTTSGMMSIPPLQQLESTVTQQQRPQQQQQQPLFGSTGNQTSTLANGAPNYNAYFTFQPSRYVGDRGDVINGPPGASTQDLNSQQQRQLMMMALQQPQQQQPSSTVTQQKHYYSSPQQ